jgi:cell division septation protein DedD
MTMSPRPWTVLKRTKTSKKIVVAGRFYTLDEANRKATQLRREGYRPFVVKTRKVKIS